MRFFSWTCLFALLFTAPALAVPADAEPLRGASVHQPWNVSGRGLRPVGLFSARPLHFGVTQ